MKKIVALLIILIGGQALIPQTSRSAESQLQGYLRTRATSDPSTETFWKIFIGGGGQGIEAMNIYLKMQKNQKPVYCPPGKLTIGNEGYVSILNDYLERMEKEGKGINDKPGVDVTLALLAALIDVFPCGNP